MFLNQLSNDWQKDLFFELAALFIVDSEFAFLKAKEEILSIYKSEAYPEGYVGFRSIFDNPDKYLRRAKEEILQKYSSDPIIKQEVIQTLISNGEDIFNLTSEKIQPAMIRVPKIFQEVLIRTIYLLVQSKFESGLTLNSKEKKIILCELIGLAFNRGEFKYEEKNLLHHVCEALDIEAEYIDEFAKPMENLFKINKELTYLINE